MPKELRELLAQLDKKKTEVRSLMEKDDVQAAEKVMEEVRALQSKIAIEQSLHDSENDETRSGVPLGDKGADDDSEYRGLFMKALKNKSLTLEERAYLDEKEAEVRAMSGASDEDGGLVIPKDIQTKINELARSFDALEQYVSTESVRTRSGSRVLEKNSDIVPFAEINELGDIPETDNPKFTNLTYTVKDYAGILPLSRSLIQDSDQNIVSHVTKWLGKKSRITRNVLILAALATFPKRPIAGLDDIKDVFNVELDPAIEAGAIVLTNQSGYNYLDKLKTADGKYAMQPDPTDATRKLLFGTHPVVKISNRFLKNEVTVDEEDDSETVKAPIILGDLKEAIVIFKRENMELASTEVGGKAFTRNTLDLRAIQRDDVKVWDEEAAIYGQIDITPAP